MQAQATKSETVYQFSADLRALVSTLFIILCTLSVYLDGMYVVMVIKEFIHIHVHLLHKIYKMTDINFKKAHRRKKVIQCMYYNYRV